MGKIPLEGTAPRCLVDQLWGESSVGMIGGASQCAKSWLGPDPALSVANLYLRRTGNRLVLVSEHRAAPASSPVQLALVSADPTTTRPEIAAEAREEIPSDPETRVLALLASGQERT